MGTEKDALPAHILEELRIFNNEPIVPESGRQVPIVIVDNSDKHEDVKGTTVAPVDRISKDNKLELLLRLHSSLIGKDKIAKTVLHALYLFHALLRQFHNEKTLIQRWSVIISRYLMSQIRVLGPQLSIFRYSLRFGNGPFHLWQLMSFIISEYTSTTTATTTTTSSLWRRSVPWRQLIDTCFTLCDEMILFYKLGVWSNTKVYRFVRGQRMFSLHCNILMNIFNVTKKIRCTRRKITELEVELELKKSITDFSTEIHSPPYDDQRATVDKEQVMQAELITLHERKRTEAYELLRLLLDGIVNSIIISRIKPSSAAICNVIHLASGILGLHKVWHLTLEQGQHSIDKISK
ncbi:hypothetical protein NCAS_0B01810 [Naumovozyma castellii]|uniref:Peroxisomal membrane protein PEX25 n=1 Tax=Naumovozyma castellii TaxID=27288 RepID=G0VBD9_NAUCA|nr:hypothetical protein NCAS_0B01810 [Naumovozyma castellii CBS 4309]CCC68265.1 hypothetical protein NCAS_0B01810 [Naumovozyma castellii CBS 4309]